VTQWGDPNRSDGLYYYPYIIFHDLYDEMFYIGDNFTVQMFSKDGKCLQKLGGRAQGLFDCACGICVLDDKLYVSDCFGMRIVIFRR